MKKIITNKDTKINSPDKNGEPGVLDIYNMYVDTTKRLFVATDFPDNKRENRCNELMSIMSGYKIAPTNSIVNRYTKYSYEFSVPDTEFLIDDGDFILGSIGKVLRVRDVFNVRDGFLFWCILTWCVKDRNKDILESIGIGTSWSYHLVEHYRHDIQEVLGRGEYYIYYPVLGKNSKTKFRKVKYTGPLDQHSNIRFRDTDTGVIFDISPYDDNWKIALSPDMLLWQLEYLKAERLKNISDRVEDNRRKRAEYIKKARKISEMIEKDVKNFIFEEDRLNDILGL